MEEVGSDQTCHTGPNYRHLLLVLALSKRHLGDALQLPTKRVHKRMVGSPIAVVVPGAWKVLRSKIK
jgi:hypothetical protein